MQIKRNFRRMVAERFARYVLARKRYLRNVLAKRLRAMGYKYDEDGYKSPDITTLSEHLAETGVAGMCLQQEPDPLVWVWMNNGMLVSITFDRDLDVISVTWHETLGAVESVAVVPSGRKRTGLDDRSPVGQWFHCSLR